MDTKDRRRQAKPSPTRKPSKRNSGTAERKLSIFFKVETVMVSGCNKYSAWEVSEASGVEKGSNLMTVSRAQISGNVISKLPYVGAVRVGIKLPDTVNIEITELDVVYSIEDAEGNW